MSLVIRGLGTSRPDHQIDQTDAAEIARTFIYGQRNSAVVLNRIFRGTQVRRRASVLLQSSNGSGPRQSFYAPAANELDRGPSTGSRMEAYGRHAKILAVDAAAQAIERAALPVESITHLVTVSCTGFSAPGVDVALVAQLGLPRQVARVHVGFMGCHGALNGLRTAKAFAEADPQARVLLCAVELCSLHYHYGPSMENLVANALFADGAAALVADGASRAAPGAWRVVAVGSFLALDDSNAMAWHIGDHGFEMTLSPQIPELIVEHFCPWLDAWLRELGLSIDRVGSWAIHPGGPRILNVLTEALNLPLNADRASRDVLSECGNMSSPTVLFVIQRLQKMKAELPCVALAFGPGLAVEAALLA